MRTRLFWKILLGFWLTFFAITQGVWFLVELRRGDRMSREQVMVREVAPLILAEGKASIERSGRDGFTAFAAMLGPRQRMRLQIVPEDAPETAPRSGLISPIARVATAPDGERLELRYWRRRPPAFRLFFGAPPGLLIFGILGGLIFAGTLAWYLTRPINQLRAAFDRLANGNLSTRLGPVIGTRRDELADLARDFDLMAQRLEQLVATRDRLLHDVSHELRSPIARLQLATGLARQSPAKIGSSLDRIEHEAARLDTLVGELLMLARTEHMAETGDEYFDLAGILRTVVEDARFEIDSAGVTIKLAEYIPVASERPSIHGNGELLRRAIDNVVRNAVRFSPRGRKVDIAIAYDTRAEAYTIDVADEGPGISAEQLASMFDPFVRGEQDGNGFGLGLAIASRALAAHRGAIVARRRSIGGLMVSMTIPALGNTVSQYDEADD